MPPHRSRIGILHFNSNATPGHYFPALAKHHDRRRYRMVMGSLSRAGALQARAADEGVETLALGIEDRRQYVSAVLDLARWIRRERIRIVQTHLFDGSLVGLAAARIARVPLRI